jgi:hypothetical protein
MDPASADREWERSDAPAGLRLAWCPEPGCLAPARVYAEAQLDSSAGVVGHARTYCLSRHLSQLPVAQIPGLQPDSAAVAARSGAPR